MKPLFRQGALISRIEIGTFTRQPRVVQTLKLLNDGLLDDAAAVGRQRLPDQLLEAVLAATPEEWLVAVLMDWSGGFWRRMAADYPRLQVL